jgi:hypothetical protein
VSAIASRPRWSSESRPSIRRRLLAAHDRLDPTGFACMLTWLDAGDPQGEVGAAYLAKELLRDTYLAPNVLEARRRLVAFYDYCHTSDVPELDASPAPSPAGRHQPCAGTTLGSPTPPPRAPT